MADTPLTTVLHYYGLDPRSPEYVELTAKLKGMGLQKFASLPTDHRESTFMQRANGQTLTLETAHLFDNQWNAAPLPGDALGWRVFDWRELVYFNSGRECTNFKQGYWLEQTPEMAHAREHTYACGYCGYQTHEPAGAVFHLDCLESAYLKTADLRLLRLVPVRTYRLTIPERRESLRPELTPEETAYLMPLYLAAQTKGRTAAGIKRIASRREKVISKAKEAMETATIERDGMLWLLDRGLSTENVIYYSHTRRFSWGWQSALDASTCSHLLDLISEFPYPYELKCADGRTLSGD